MIYFFYVSNVWFWVLDSVPDVLVLNQIQALDLIPGPSPGPGPVDQVLEQVQVCRYKTHSNSNRHSQRQRARL